MTDRARTPDKRTLGRPATHTFEPCLGQVLAGGLAADAAGLYLLSVAGVHLVRA